MMIKHVVMWRFKQPKEENLHKTVELLQSLPEKIDAIKTLETGVNVNTTDAAYELVLITTHDNMDKLKEYANHPEHLQAAEFIKSAASERVVVDYEF